MRKTDARKKEVENVQSHMLNGTNFFHRNICEVLAVLDSIFPFLSGWIIINMNG